jgi:hypothetical protein
LLFIALHSQAACPFCKGNRHKLVTTTSMYAFCNALTGVHYVNARPQPGLGLFVMLIMGSVASQFRISTRDCYCAPLPSLLGIVICAPLTAHMRILLFSGWVALRDCPLNLRHALAAKPWKARTRVRAHQDSTQISLQDSTQIYPPAGPRFVKRLPSMGLRKKN